MGSGMSAFAEIRIKEEEEALGWKVFRVAKADVRCAAQKECFRIRLARLKHVQEEAQEEAR